MCVIEHHDGGIGKRSELFIYESVIYLIEASSNLVALAQYFIFPLMVLFAWLKNHDCRSLICCEKKTPFIG
jgi:hypothetical protein